MTWFLISAFVILVCILAYAACHLAGKRDEEAERDRLRRAARIMEKEEHERTLFRQVAVLAQLKRAKGKDHD